MAESATILIPDISGYTEFLTKTELVHSSHIINQGWRSWRPSIVGRPVSRKGRFASSGRRFALLAPERIAGSVNTDHLAVGIRVGHRGVGLTANKSRAGFRSESTAWGARSHTARGRPGGRPRPLGGGGPRDVAWSRKPVPISLHASLKNAAGPRAEQEQPTMDALLAWVGEPERLWAFRIGHSVGTRIP